MDLSKEKLVEFINRQTCWKLYENSRQVQHKRKRGEKRPADYDQQPGQKMKKKKTNNGKKAQKPEAIPPIREEKRTII